MEFISRVVPAGTRGDDRAKIIHHAQGNVLVIADGAGGSRGGSEAADSVLLWTSACCSGNSDIRSDITWSRLLEKIDYQVEAAGGETTAVIVSIWEHGLVGASVGDSAAWLIHPDQCDDLTANQQRKPLLGRGNAKPVAFARDAADGTLILASDGLVKYASRQRICQACLLPNLNAAADALVDLVRLPSDALQDDVAIILYRPTHKSAAPPDRRRYTLTEGGDMVEDRH